MSDYYVFVHNCSFARMLQRSRVGAGMNRFARGGGGGRSMKHFEGSNGLDTGLGLYKT